jgi:hypothetical protein
MQQIDFVAGTSIHDAARKLVASAPAFGVFNGIRIRARHATTHASDVVHQFHREMDTRCVVWANSAEGKRAAAERATEIVQKQATVDRHIERLLWLDCSDPRAVLYWLGGIVEAADDVGVTYDRKFVVETFTARGWDPGVNCGPEFNESDARNFAGYIVGQWLECGHPMVLDFIERWRKRFDGA